MPMNRIQFQAGVSLPKFFELYGNSPPTREKQIRGLAEVRA